MKAFITDCEGPISKNDNAFELTANYVPNGDRLFAVISSYDDVLAYVLRRSGYKAGDTLKLILPFLKAYGVTDEVIHEFSAKNLVLMRKAREMLHYVGGLAAAYIVSTSFEHYVRALCQAVDFPFDRAYCTKLRIDDHRISESEAMRIRILAEEIAHMPVIEIPKHARSLEDLSKAHRKAVERLDDIFWRILAEMSCGVFFSEVNPVGGFEKAEAVKDAAAREHVSLKDVMYVGDSITDVEAFRLVRENGGLTVSFNGNRYAVENAEIVVLAEHCLATAAIAEVFTRYGKSETLKVIAKWSVEALQEAGVNPMLIEELEGFERFPKAKIVTRMNVEALVRESSEYRKTVRGEAIGRLG